MPSSTVLMDDVRVLLTRLILSPYPIIYNTDYAGKNITNVSFNYNATIDVPMYNIVYRTEVPAYVELKHGY